MQSETHSLGQAYISVFVHPEAQEKGGGSWVS